MLRASSVLVVIVAPLVLAIAAPEITAAAVLDSRQNSDPSLVGWVSTSGQSSFSVQRSCDFPATLSRSDNYAQCCATTGACNFFTSCSAGNLLAASTSVFCDTGVCNTGVIVPSLGASEGQSFLGCWPTAYGQSAFNLVQDIGSATPPNPSTTSGTATPSGRTTSTGTGSSITDSGTGTTSAAATSASRGAAAGNVQSSVAGLLGAAAVAMALL